MAADDDPNDSDRSKVLRAVATFLALVGIASLTGAVVWNPTAEDNVNHVLHELLIQVWPFTLTTAAALLIYELRLRRSFVELRRSFVEELKQVSGPSIIGTMQPRLALETFLAHIYGNEPKNSQVATAVMGGSGDRNDRSDLTISTNTEVTLHLEDVEDPSRYKLTTEVDYTFIRPPANNRFAVFAISAPDLREKIMLSCDLPLFDYVYFPSSENADESSQNLDESTRTLLRDVKVVIRYTNASRVERRSSTNVKFDIVPEEDWPEYLGIFRRDVGSLKKSNPASYRKTMKILSCDLGVAVAAEEAESVSIDGLQLKLPTLQSKSDGYCFWLAAYPSLVKQISFHATDFSPERDGERWEFRVAPFSPGGTQHDEWVTPSRLSNFPVNAWMLPGHGVALVWRSQSNHQTEDLTA